MATPTDPVIPQYPGSNVISSTTLVPVFDAGNPQQRVATLSDIADELTDIAPAIDSITQDIVIGDFTDGGGAAGTLVMTDTIPAGALLLYAKVTVGTAFAGDSTSVITIGDGSDVDRYMTGTPSVQTAAATGLEMGVPSGAKLLLTANAPTITITEDDDFTDITTGAMTVSIYYIRTV